MSMRDEVLEHELHECHGWAFDECDQPAKWLMIEHWEGGSWAASGLCQKHAHQVLDGMDSEFRPPLWRAWWHLQTFIEQGEWP